MKMEFTGKETKDELNSISKKAVKKIKRQVPNGTCSDCTNYHYSATCMNEGIEKKPWNTCKNHQKIIKLMWAGVASTFVVVLLFNIL